jgi:hypothetical protein
MKIANKKLLFVKEMPENTGIDMSDAKRISNAEFAKLVRSTKKKPVKKVL